MLFNTFQYGLFLVVVLAVYYRLGRKQQNLFLLAASYYFYSCWDVRFLTLIIISTVVDYWASLWITKQRVANRMGAARLGLFASLVTNLGILGFFKYFNFFSWGAARLLSAVGLHVSSSTLNIILPVGISFYTFQTISYTSDVYRGKVIATRDFFDFALFVGFFPQLVAGPIERASNLLPQIQSSRTVTKQDFGEGLCLITTGLIRKVVIADTAGAVADLCFGDPSSRSSLQLACGLLLYALQIYGDFAGYSDMARGSARLLGIRLMQNFRQPYFSTNISEFWHRWHISLSGWLRDYLYIPLGGNRKGSTRTCINILITMFLGGLWHGAHWTFVFWGLLHGIYLIIHRAYRSLWPEKEKEYSRSYLPKLWKVIAGALTFVAVVLAWLPFRMNSLPEMRLYLARLCDFSDGTLADLVPLMLLGSLTLAIDIPKAVYNSEMCFLKWPFPFRVLAVACSVLLLIACAHDQYTPFIYFQF